MSNDQLLREHRETWSGFVKLLVWSIVAIAVVLGGMALFLT